VVVLVVAFVKHAEEATAGLVVVPVLFGLTLAIEGGDAVEEELGDVGEGYGVAASEAEVRSPTLSRSSLAAASFWRRRVFICLRT
jgi:hypothetical protein